MSNNFTLLSENIKYFTVRNPPGRNNRYEKAYPFEPSVKAEGEKILTVI